jgi:hypothetical protein
MYEFGVYVILFVLLLYLLAVLNTLSTDIGDIIPYTWVK